MRRIFIVIMIALTLVFNVSCSNDSSPPDSDQPAEVPETEGVIQAPVSPISPISTPVSNTNDVEIPDQVDIPDPEGAFGSVGGILLVKTPEEEIYKPLPINPVYLAPLIPNEDGSAYFAGLNYETDPTATTNQTGIFIIQNVPAGDYGFVVMRGVTPYLIKNEEGKDFIITVEAGKALNLNEVRAELPPL